MLVPLGTAECAVMGEKSDAPSGAKDGGAAGAQGFTPLPRPGSPLMGFGNTLSIHRVYFRLSFVFIRTYSSSFVPPLVFIRIVGHIL